MPRKCHHGKIANGWDNVRGTTVHYYDADGKCTHTKLVTSERCWECKEVLSVGPSNDAGVEEEIDAARLLAAYETADDRGDVLDNPRTRRLIDHILGDGECLDEDYATLVIYDVASSMDENENGLSIEDYCDMED